MECDAVVVGAGIVGSAAAYELAKRDLGKVILLEQFDALHEHGSSHGKTRITRRAYWQPYYIKMMDEAHRMWSILERESDTTLYKKTGILLFGEPDSPKLRKTIQSLDLNQVAYDIFSGEEAKRRYPQLTLPANYKCVYDKEGGILLADKALAAFQDQFVKHGGNLLFNHQVTNVVPGSLVTVVTNKGTFLTKKLVVTAGAWTKALCNKLGVHLPFEVIRTQIHYFEVDDPEVFSYQNFPSFALYGSTTIYGSPVYECPGKMKIAELTGVNFDINSGCDPPHVNTLPSVMEFIDSTFKGVSSKPSRTEHCLFTMSPDLDAVIDRHPHYPNVVFASGFSGHGFKLSPVFGKIITELLLDDTPSFDVTPFRFSRFQTVDISV